MIRSRSRWNSPRSTGAGSACTRPREAASLAAYRASGAESAVMRCRQVSAEMRLQSSVERLLGVVVDDDCVAEPLQQHQADAASEHFLVHAYELTPALRPDARRFGLQADAVEQPHDAVAIGRLQPAESLRHFGGHRHACSYCF